MSYYFEIRILDDPDFPSYQILSAVYNRLHEVLVRFNCDHIGVSFPDYQLKPRSLGSKIRLYGSKEHLNQLLEDSWLKRGLRDHITVTELLPVPSGVKYCHFSRSQPKLNVERLIRRHQHRHDLSYEEAAAKYEGANLSNTSLPFVRIRSQSTAQEFALFIQQSELLDQPLEGVFNTYGLSSDATVPWF